MLKLYNTLSRKKEKFKPLQPPKVGIYICGPTVYDYSHIGHIRTYINSDVLTRTLRFLNYKPFIVMNITDVGHLTGDRDMGEDKLEKAAREKKQDIWEIAKFYTDYFWQTMSTVNVGKPDVVCPATKHIQEMIALVKKLEEKGYTYKTSDGIYFDTSKFRGYGKLANLDIEGLKEGARVEKNPEKKNPTDFGLWKFSPKDGAKRQMEWDSPWGVGFPGWHIECSAMSVKYLGETFDIHTGGVDHINVHHTNEISQSEAATGKKFVNYWFHSEHLLINGEKMSKSLGNFYKLEDIKAKGFEPLVLRYLFLTAHYRTRMNFTWEGLETAQKTLEKLYQIISDLHISVSDTTNLPEEAENWERRFVETISNDLNMPQALATVWEMLKSELTNKEKYQLLLRWDRVLGLDLGSKKILQLRQASKVPAEIDDLVKKREELRKQEKWQEADEIRKKIEAKDWILKDTVQGTAVSKK